jgi:hypothetical protein
MLRANGKGLAEFDGDNHLYEGAEALSPEPAPEPLLSWSAVGIYEALHYRDENPRAQQEDGERTHSQRGPQSQYADDQQSPDGVQKKLVQLHGKLPTQE